MMFSMKINFPILMSLILPMISIGTAAAESKGWKTLVNQYGFSVQYPGDWGAFGMLEGTVENPEHSPTVIIEGPLSLIPRHNEFRAKEYVHIELGQADFPYGCGKHTVGEKIRDPFATKLRDREFQLAGESAYEVTSSRAAGGGPNRTNVQMKIDLCHEHKPYYIIVTELGSETYKMKSDREWKYHDVIEKIFYSFKFIEIKTEEKK